jgi:hypothetical protein
MDAPHRGSYMRAYVIFQRKIKRRIEKYPQHLEQFDSRVSKTATFGGIEGSKNPHILWNIT